MEKQGIAPNGYDSPPPPYFHGPPHPPHAAAAGGQPSDQPVGSCASEYQKTPLYPIQGQGYPTGPYCAQPVGYGQQPAAVVFVQPTPLPNPPQDHLGYSIFVTVCCCWIIGIFAIIKAAECRSAVAAGDRATAEHKSQQAKKLANIGLGLGIVSIVVAVALLGIYYGVVISQLRH